MKIPFHKYQGTGNDFVMIDQRERQFLSRESVREVRDMCDRHFGIGADGLILLQNLPGHDFEMIYFNADGNESTMCGNGGRCIVAFARSLGIIGDTARFRAIDGIHEARINEDNWVELSMSDVEEVLAGDDHFILNTGSPHFVTFVDSLSGLDVEMEGRKIRYSEPFSRKGINVNFVMESGDAIEMATYERGVEAETLSCGTGVTAASIAYAKRSSGKSHFEIDVKTKGGKLVVKFNSTGDKFTDIWLCGPVEKVFEGNYFSEKTK